VPATRRTPKPPDEPTLSIGALARAAGVPVETIRTWERRYGVPRAHRRPSGHRVYPLAAVAHLRRVVQALERGHRPADVLPLAPDRLDALLDAAGAAAVPARSGVAAGRRGGRRAVASLDELLGWIAASDGTALQAALEGAALGQPPLRFLEDTVAPLMRRVGAEWKAGRLDVRHEHLASARVAEVLGALRRRLERPGRGPVAALALLPGDAHELGLLMASVLFAAAGWRVVYLGAETPAAQLRALARDTALDAVAVGVSATAPAGETRDALEALRRSLPAGVPLLAGGTGAPARAAGITGIKDLRALDRWLARRGKAGR
jgi:methanogenic corrinoid protein MtbC1